MHLRHVQGCEYDGVYKHLGITVTPISVDKMHNHSTNVYTERQSEPSHPLNEVSRDTIRTVPQTLESKLLEGIMQEIKMLRESTTAATASSRNLESLRKRFEMNVAISTFSASLIIVFGSFIRNLLVESVRNRRLFNALLLFVIQFVPSGALPSHVNTIRLLN
ncbi:hypothetical protein JOM56_015451 [Amanita muscaria]